MEDSAFPTPAINKSPKKSKRFLFLIVAIVIILIIIFAGNKFLGSNSNEEESDITPTPTEFQIPTDTPTPSLPEETSTPTPKSTTTPTPKSASNPVDKTTGLDRSKLSIEVQNGSGEAGVAGKGSGILKDLGYNITSTGNADNFDYSSVTIKVKSSKSNYLTLLKKDLSASYTIGSSSSDLSASSSADALVIIGK